MDARPRDRAADVLRGLVRAMLAGIAGGLAAALLLILLVLVVHRVQGAARTPGRGAAPAAGERGPPGHALRRAAAARAQGAAVVAAGRAG